jgi:hypothetical protein
MTDPVLSRYVGLPARGRIINLHSVPEVWYDGGWHLLDASLMFYLIKPDGKIASVDEMKADIQAWKKEHPEIKNDTDLKNYSKNEGWKNGPALLARSHGAASTKASTSISAPGEAGSPVASTVQGAVGSTIGWSSWSSASGVTRISASCSVSIPSSTISTAMRTLAKPVRLPLRHWSMNIFEFSMVNSMSCMSQ